MVVRLCIEMHSLLCGIKYQVILSEKKSNHEQDELAIGVGTVHSTQHTIKWLIVVGLRACFNVVTCKNKL